MAFDFPNAPVLDDEFVDAASGAVYKWNGLAWKRKAVAAGTTPPPLPYLPLAGGTMTGPIQLVSGAPVAPTEATNKNWVETRPIDGGTYVFTMRDGQLTSAQSYGKNDLPRWSMNMGEGDDADFRIKRFNDGGGLMGDAISVSRRTGIVDFGTLPTVKGKSILADLEKRIAILEKTGRK